MLLETFTGKRPTDPMFSGELSLKQWVSQALPMRIREVADEKILQDEVTRRCFDHPTNLSVESSLNERRDHFLASIFKLGLVCSSESPEQRMGMIDVVAKLQDIKKDYFVSRSAKSSEFLDP